MTNQLDDIRQRATIAEQSAVGAIRVVRTDVPRLLGALDAVLAPHVRRKFDPLADLVMFGQRDFPDRCEGCRNTWPCPTVTTVNGALEDIK